MSRSLTTSACFTLASAACGGAIAGPSPGSTGADPVGSASVTGTLSGKTVPANDALGTNLTTSTNGVVTTSRTVVITNVANACQCNGAPTYSTRLVLVVGTPGTAVATGTYSFPRSTAPPSQTGVAEMHYVVDDPQTTLRVAASGAVTFSQISALTTAGSFDASFPSGDHITGTFSAPTCDAAVRGAVACP